MMTLPATIPGVPAQGKKMYTVHRARNGSGRLVLENDFDTHATWVKMNGGVLPVVHTERDAETIAVELREAFSQAYVRFMEERAEATGTEWSKTPNNPGKHGYEVKEATDTEIKAWSAHVGYDIEQGSAYDAGALRVC